MDNINMDPGEMGWGLRTGLIWPRIRSVGGYEHNSEPWDCIECREVLEWQQNWLPLEKDSVPCS
jgi:hypothetical protein